MTDAMDGSRMGGVWICSGCGLRSIGGRGGTAWRWAGDRWQHRCDGAVPQCGAFDARRVELDSVREALLACVQAMSRWGEGRDGVPSEAWDAFTFAHAELGVPLPEDASEARGRRP